MQNSIEYSLHTIDIAVGFIFSNIFSKNIICIDGEMGAGKTTLIKQICKKLNVIDDVTSPTFSIINEYYTQLNEKIFHFDFYRLNSVAEAIEIGVEDYFYSKNMCFIEWKEKIAQLLPQENTVVFTIQIIDDTSRKISINT